MSGYSGPADADHSVWYSLQPVDHDRQQSINLLFLRYIVMHELPYSAFCIGFPAADLCPHGRVMRVSIDETVSVAANLF